jgi:hypothetical protein
VQSVHCHLLGDNIAAADDLSPAALYDIFVSFCKRKLHMIIAYNCHDHQWASDMFATNPALSKKAIHLVVEVSYIL